MPGETPRSTSLIERDVREHARLLTELVTRLGRSDDRIDKIETTMSTEAAVAVERRSNLDGRLERIESSVAQVFGLGRWVLGGVGALLLAAIVGFILKGGLIG